jgi:hypothetical protein
MIFRVYNVEINKGTKESAINVTSIRQEEIWHRRRRLYLDVQVRGAEKDIRVGHLHRFPDTVWVISAFRVP